jgi:NTP pyrophosphatase (non-canonical NTP hydrolase)
MPRAQVTKQEIEKAFDFVKKALEGRLMQKGDGAFASHHEIYGVLAEEFDELRDELRKNTKDDFAGELIDIAVGAVFAIACVKSNKVGK